MTITLETHGHSDDRYRVLKFGEDKQDYLMSMHCDPDNMDSWEFRRRVFDILWQLSGGKYD